MANNENAAPARDLDTRRRRAAYRANHRGTKEMDWLIGRFADAHLDGFDEQAMARFERLIELPDPQLQKWILEHGHTTGGEFDELIVAIRVFHGLARPPAA